MVRVLKFGGSSLSSTKRVENAAEIAQKTEQGKHTVIMVVSAVGGITDMLIDCAYTASKDWIQAKKKIENIKKRHYKVYGKKLQDPQTQKQVEKLFGEFRDLIKGISLVQECSPQTLDLIVSFGERWSALLMSALLKNNNAKSEYVDARELFITEKKHGGARLLEASSTHKILERFNQNKIYVVTGYISRTEDGITTNLGRGGSDFTASFIGAALNVEKIEIWTDVDGFMSADPRMVKDAFVLPKITYEEAMELSYFGAKVIHPQTLAPAIQKNIPVVIRNSFKPENPGTIISKEGYDSEHPVKGIASFDGISLINVQGSGMVGVPGIANRLFGAMADQDINVIMISQASSERSICFVVKTKDADHACSAIRDEFETEIIAKKIDSIEHIDELTIIAAVGEDMRGTPGISGKLFAALGRNAINVIAIAQGSSERNVSLVIQTAEAFQAVNAIHSSFYLEHRISNLFLIGTGNIGSTLLSQIQGAQHKLLKESGLLLQLCGLANEDKMMFDKEGINIKKWQNTLLKSENSSDLDLFLHKLRELRLANSILIDATASKNVASRYHEFLSYGIHVVTPNKLANTMEQKYYNKLKSMTVDHRLHYYYETTVGAGLPIINTIQGLIRSGDEVTKIQGILSGTLSYLFNNLSKTKKFSQVLKEAYEKGFTEPDPRDDLLGMDVARKLLIMAREIGLDMELSDVQIEYLVPEKYRSIPLDEFWERSHELDDNFTSLLEKAHKKDKVIRYIASLENKRCKVQIEYLEKNNELAQCSATDNIIRITTKRYHDSPMIIKGPGAGREVTAAGVLADIIRLAFHLN
jgi:aspartokinase/homoserine dehydrogenase 1